MDGAKKTMNIQDPEKLFVTGDSAPTLRAMNDTKETTNIQDPEESFATDGAPTLRTMNDVKEITNVQDPEKPFATGDNTPTLQTVGPQPQHDKRPTELTAYGGLPTQVPTSQNPYLDTQHTWARGNAYPVPPPPPPLPTHGSGWSPFDYERPPVYGGLKDLYPHQSPVQQYKNYVKFRITHASKKASMLRLIHNTLQFTILLGAALISISLGFPSTPPWFPPLLGGIVTIATAIANYYKFGERSRDLYRSAEDMQRDYNWFKSHRGVYKNLNDDEAFYLLQDRIDTFKREEFLRSFAFEEQKESST